MSEEDEILILMAKEVVDDVCGAIKEVSDRSKCKSILHKILVRGTGFEAIYELSEDARKIIKEKLKEFGF